VILKVSKKQVLDIRRHLKIVLAYNLLGYDEDNYYAPSGEKTVRIGLVVAKKYFFYYYKTSCFARFKTLFWKILARQP
jgi:hypothetical protein